MQPEAGKLLEDIRQAADRIARYVADRPWEEYATNDFLRSAVERQFTIIGEALAQLTRRDPEVASRITAHRQIVDFRNVLTHVYDSVDDEVVWDAVVSKLPVLQCEVQALLVQAEGDEPV